MTKNNDKDVIQHIPQEAIEKLVYKKDDSDIKKWFYKLDLLKMIKK